MKFAPMLAEKINPVDLAGYISNPQWWMEQKIDGVRLLLKIEDGRLSAANRRGEITTVPAPLLAALGGMEGRWYLDGEWLNGTFWVFDLPYAMDRITPATPLEQRRTSLEAVYRAAWSRTGVIRLIEASRTAADKRALLYWCRDNNAEGVMIKKKTAPYRPGKRSPEMVKAKFTETADCVIMEVGREGKASCSLGLYENGKLRDVGAVKMTGKNLASARPGQVVEIRYLYATADVRLYGPPVFLGFRTDKAATECTTDQLKFVNKSVRDLTVTERKHP